MTRFIGAGRGVFTRVVSGPLAYIRSTALRVRRADYWRVISPQWHSWRWALKLALIAVFFTLLTVFVADNFVMVEMRLIFWDTEIRLGWSLLLAAILGFLLGVLTARLRR